MHETKSKFLRDIMGEETPSDASDKEWQRVQAFSLRVDMGDGRRVESFPWSHYGGYCFTDDGETEKVTVLFGARALVIEGYNLHTLLRELDDGRRRTVRKMPVPEAKLALHGGEKEKALITRLTCLPAFEMMINEIQGDEHDNHGHVRRAARR